MSIQTKPRIVTDSMMLYLDAANLKSYSGSTWNDISGNSSTVTLVGSPSFDTPTSSFVFTGTSYADVNVTNLSNNGLIVVEMWCRWNASFGGANAGGMFFGFNSYDVWTYGGTSPLLGYNTGLHDVYGISNATVVSSGLIGNWKQYVFTMGGNRDIPTTNKMHINGVPQTLAQQLNTTGSASAFPSSTPNMRINGFLNNTNFPNSMNLSIMRVYNRGLTDSEVVQNFEANRKRFGI